MKKSITRDEWSTLILLLAVLLGAFIRFNPAMLAGFAINDGGMFAVMIDDLKANHYLLPAFTTYNHSNIPFAYPPLGFYLGGLASSLLHMETVQVLRWLPALFASLTIPALYLLALRLSKNKYLATLSTLFFAFVPRAFFWFVMGGGLTRSLGQIFMLLALASIVRLYEEKRRSDIFLSGIFGGLAVLSHPEAAVHTAISALLIWIVLSRKRTTFFHSVLVGVIVLVVSAPWWGAVIYRHGVGPLLSAMQTGSKSLAIFNLVFFTFTDEPYATFIAVIGLIGIAYRLIRRDYLLPLWMAVPFLVAGRSAANLAVIPLAMLAAVGLAEVILPALQPSAWKEAGKSNLLIPVERNVSIYLMLYLVFSAYQFGFQLSASTLRPSDQAAMAWVRKNTAADSSFVVLTGTSSVACDSVSEWFPALTGRRSIYTVQGTEWTLAEKFGGFIQKSADVQACMNEDAACFEDAVGPSTYDYIYISKILQTNNCAPVDGVKKFPYFIERIKGDGKFEVMYETGDVLVLKRR
ncbi:MAG: hypothetical protein C3F07_00960 [Anaerolineales bacterium]|nr:glycosyltransferase family 39 protein [Anaerolineae bacterium]PWB77912.1 MAG: hypothetical protein C3F07_00960 [Anaerolineales bacterium]